MTGQKPDRYLAALRGATVPCGECKGKSLVKGETLHDDLMGLNVECPTCRGSGRVALVPGLTRECADEDGVIRTVPVDADRALGALLDWIYERRLGVFQSSAKVLPDTERWFVEKDEGWATGSTLAEAVARALGLVEQRLEAHSL